MHLAILCVLIVQQQDHNNQQLNSFENNMAAVALFQQIEGEWEIAKIVNSGREEDLGRHGSPSVSASKYELTISNTGLSWKLVAYSNDMDAFKIEREHVDTLMDAWGIATINDDRLVIVIRHATFGYFWNKPRISPNPGEVDLYMEFTRRD